MKTLVFDRGRGRTRMVSTVLGMLMLVVAAFAAGCGDAGSSDSAGAQAPAASSSESKSSDTGPIKIGFASSMTGGLSVYDAPLLDAAKIAMKEINADGGVNGRKLEAVVSDSASDPVKAGTAAKDVLAKGANMVVTACDYDLGQAAARAATAAKVVSMQCAGGDLAGYTGLGALHFNVQPGTPSEGTTLAQFATDEGWKKVALLTDTTFAYDTDLCKWFEQQYKKRGGTIVDKQEYKASDTAIPNQVSHIKSSGADAVVVCAFLPSGASAIKQLRNVTSMPIMSGLGMDGTSWIKGITNASDIYLTVAAAMTGDDPHPEVNDFFKTFQQETGKPAALGVPAYGYEMVKLFAKAVEDAGTTDGPAVAAAMGKFSDVDVLGEKFTFTNTCHRTPRPHAVMQIQSGKMTFKTLPKVSGIPETC